MTLEPHRHGGPCGFPAPTWASAAAGEMGRQDGQTKLRGLRGPFLVRSLRENMTEGKPHTRLLVGLSLYPPWCVGWVPGEPAELRTPTEAAQTP